MLTRHLRQLNSFSSCYNQIRKYQRDNLIKTTSQAMPELKEIVRQLNVFANENLAEKWDNVGLLIEPYTARAVKKILLTNDLTEAVMKEAIDVDCDLIISYHPPIFASLKRLTQKSWKERIVTMCLENRIALYSPHTSWDSVEGGINDWLAKCLPLSDSQPIERNASNPEIGAGRLCTLNGPFTLKNAVACFKTHLCVDTLHISPAVGKDDSSQIQTVAICAGSGASLLKNVRADLYFTGEMSHHEVLDAVHGGAHVILSNHSNSERGFLKEFRTKFLELVDNSVQIVISQSDEDPLKSV